MVRLNTLFSVAVLLLALISLRSFASPLEKASAFFIFGDSTVDAGNNNYIQTVHENKASTKPPYGQNGFFGGPTGRFSDGRIIADFIAEYAKLPLIPPFLQPLAEFTNGANFACGGAGILSQTHQGVVIDLQTQLKYFEEVQKTLAKNLGDEKAKELISEAVYFISIGSNDYMGGYLDNPKMRELHPPEEYVGMVIGNLSNAIQTLYGKGARKFGFLSLAPLGCLPAFRAMKLEMTKEEGCFEEASALALAHNNALSSVLTSSEHLLKGFKYTNSNFYNWLSDRIQNPSKFGFKEGINACCGTGPFRGIYTCGGTKENTIQYELCDNAEDYIWWDSFHPTERIHEQFAKALWNGPQSSVAPFNLEELFFDKEKLTIADVEDDPDKEQLF